jgi:cytochrome c oxidase cbb3-type subunit III
MKRALIYGALLVSAACEREERNFPDKQMAPVTLTPQNPFARPSMLYAGEPPMVGAELDPALPGYKETAFAVSEGQTLYFMFNCVGCHANGGGAMGPALMDRTWTYGSTPRDIAITIIAGRPNGMPSFRGKLVPGQLYALIAYVRSLGGFVRGDAIPARTDHMQALPPMNLDERGLPVSPKEGNP